EFNDMLRGEVSIAWSQIDMQVLMKSDGLPTYHFANVVDDHLMEISHVVRGEEWINSVPKHVLLYQYFNWTPPVFCHMPLLRNPDKSKLSKRKNPTSINYYRDMGYLPEALLNYLGMMGWTMPNGDEVFTLAAMEAAFDISRVSLGGPVFDTEKLDWLNGKYLRESGSDADFQARLLAWAQNSGRLEPIIPLLRQRVEKLSDVAPLISYFFSGPVSITPESFSHCKLAPVDACRALQFALWKLEALGTWNRDEVESALMKLAEVLDIKVRDFLAPVFVAISGQPVSLSVIDSIAVIGLDLSRARLRIAIETLGGISKKQAKNLEKEFAQLGQ
ncbi:glutamate--tRNA ligase, partial [Gammaproteobacteria bacterium]|nr:glutamate--tRNA ligase [Gammaproteobacteria bacterium]